MEMEKSASSQCECKHQPLWRIPKFPSFNPVEVALYLIQVEAFFRVARITDQRERLDYFLIHMDQNSRLLAVIKNFIHQQKHNDTSPWDLLKIDIEHNNFVSHQLPAVDYTYEDH